MKHVLTFLRRPTILFALSGISVAVSSVLIVQHLRLLTETQDTVLPLVTDVPLLERRGALLQQQLEMTQLQASLRIGSAEERIQAYVLPKEFNEERLIALFDVLGEILRGSGRNVIDSVSLGAETSARDGVSSLPITFTITGNDTVLADLFGFLRIAGMLTIADALSPAEREQLLQETEATNPAGIISVEQFLSTDLLEYTLEPQPVEDRIRRSFGEGEFQTLLQNLLDTSALADVRRLLHGQNARILKEQNLWPMPLLKIGSIEVLPNAGDGSNHLTVTVHAYRLAD